MRNPACIHAQTKETQTASLAVTLSVQDVLVIDILEAVVEVNVLIDTQIPLANFSTDINSIQKEIMSDFLITTSCSNSTLSSVSFKSFF